MLLEFLKTKRTKDELKLVLDILKEFKNNESEKEFIYCSCESWIKLEQFEDYLRLLTDTEVEKVEDSRAKEYMKTLVKSNDL